ncbi:MAG TPA: hypothetical protein PKN33_10245 [Phycisphaerae bacterium]|nr:hypothetical protein [Phycisphaerae bacterium]
MNFEIANLYIHAVCTIAMFGLIWFVQIVHYPLFHLVGRDEFVAYELRHQRLTTIVVAPLMIGEIATALALLYFESDLRWIWALVGFGLVFLIWLSTLCLQMPCHRKLESGYDAEVVRRLVRTNWLRAWAWAGRVVIAIYLLM